MKKPVKKNPLNSDLIKIAEAKHHDPFSVLGRHTDKTKTTITAYLPNAETVSIAGQKVAMQRNAC